MVLMGKKRFLRDVLGISPGLSQDEEEQGLFPIHCEYRDAALRFETNGRIVMADLYYCVKCKKKTEMKDSQQVTMKNGKPALKGQCTVCGTTVNAILSTKKVATEN